MRFILITLFLFCVHAASAQARLIIDDAVINISDGAVITIDNPDNNALVRSGTGYIISEGPDNRVAWAIGTGNNANYIIPFGNAGGYFPLSFSADAGSTDGKFVFSTYPTSTWKNSDELPPGVSNINSNGLDNSAKLVDRFWQIAPLGYTSKPTLTNISFTYNEGELALPNSIIENSLVAQRWNNVSNTWGDYLPMSVVNTADRTVTVPSINGNELYDWWALTDGAAILPVTLSAFKAVPVGNTVFITWKTYSETNSSHFEIWRSSSGQSFDPIGSVNAKGFSSIVSSYSFTDPTPYAGISYYKIRAVDLDGKFTWTETARIKMGTEPTIQLSPNPAKDIISLTWPNTPRTFSSTVTIINSRGQKLSSFTMDGSSQSIDISRLASGVYYLQVIFNKELRTLSFIKQ